MELKAIGSRPHKVPKALNENNYSVTMLEIELHITCH